MRPQFLAVAIFKRTEVERVTDQYLHAQRAGITVGGETIIERVLTQHEMAIMTNTTRETVSRAISQLQETGVVSKEGKRLIVQKLDALKHLSLDV